MNKAVVLTIVLFLANSACVGQDDTAQSPQPAEYARARETMVERQIQARDIDDGRVLQAMRTVPRHRFVPPLIRSEAYRDYPLPIGEGQTISQPYIVGLMTDLAQIDSTDKVLEIGTGSGYQAAILAELADHVYTIEIVEPLAARARAVLDSLGYGNITVRSGDGYIGWAEQAPFDAVIVTCAPEKIPQPLIDQLADGGRLVIPVGLNYQELLVATRNGDEMTYERIIPVRFVPMTGEGVRSRGGE